jgi:hypothetical protein
MEDFILELKDVLEGVRISRRPIHYLFDKISFLLSCDGDWMEFGVFSGTLLLRKCIPI